MGSAEKDIHRAAVVGPRPVGPDRGRSARAELNLARGRAAPGLDDASERFGVGVRVAGVDFVGVFHDSTYRNAHARLNLQAIAMPPARSYDIYVMVRLSGVPYCRTRPSAPARSNDHAAFR